MSAARMQKLLWSNLLAFVSSVCVFLLFSFSSCQKKQIEQSENPTNFNEIFEMFWHKMNSQYVYWDVEKTDWEAIYTQYHPLFENLSFNDADQRKAVRYFRQITEGLIDGHYRITFNKMPLTDTVISPSISRKSIMAGFHPPYNYLDVVTSYLDKGYYSATGSIINNYSSIKVITGTINQNLLYFNCNFFSLNQSQKVGDTSIEQALSYFFFQT